MGTLITESLRSHKSSRKQVFKILDLKKFLKIVKTLDFIDTFGRSKMQGKCHFRVTKSDESVRIGWREASRMTSQNNFSKANQSKVCPKLGHIPPKARRVQKRLENFPNAKKFFNSLKVSILSNVLPDKKSLKAAKFLRQIG